MILNIETSTTVCSIALSDKNKIIAHKESFEHNSHSQLLARFIDDIFKENNIKPKDLKAVAVGEGPGSYTGLRIGVSTAKGMAFSLNIPLIAIDTLLIMATDITKNFSELNNQNAILCPMIDARRMEVYTSFYDFESNKLSQTTNLVIDKNSFIEKLEKQKIIFFGDGAEKCKNLITHKNAIFIDNIYPIAQNMIEIAEQKFNNNIFEDLAYFEPFYLKPFITTIAKNKLNPNSN